MVPVKRRAIALVSVLLLSSLLLVLVMGVVRGVTTQGWSAGGHLDKIAAGYVAEAGLSQVLTQLNADRSWRTGFSHQKTHWAGGTYTVQFRDTGPFQPNDSVNNLDSDAPRTGPKGNLPPRCAYVVVVGQVGMVQRVLEAVVAPKTLLATGGPLLAQGPIELHGNVEATGLESYAGAPTQVRLHSNFAGASGSPTISWQPLSGSDELRVAGNLSAVDNRSAADVFALGGTYSVTGLHPAQPQLTPPDLNVPGQVAAHSGAAPVTWTGLNTVLAPGDYYLDSASSYAGNIVLQEGANVYVDGDLDVTGSVTGRGSMYVNGNMKLSGAAEVSSSNRVALAVEGDVTLEGFNGNKYLRDLAGAAPILHDIGRVTDAMTYYLSNPDVTPPPLPQSWPNAPPGGMPGWASSGLLGNWGALDRLNASLGGDLELDGSSPPPFFPDVRENRVGALLDLVNAQPASSQKTFVLGQLQKLREFTRWRTPFTSKEAKRDEFLAHPELDCPAALEGLFDTLNQLDTATQRRGLQAALNVISNFTVNRLGDAHFEGLVYARGTIRARNEIQVRGGLVAAGLNSRVVLENGSRLTWIKDFFGVGPEAVAYGGTLGVRHWCLR
jgi:hypothetical protein